jgi:hypothetical protein
VFRFQDSSQPLLGVSSFVKNRLAAYAIAVVVAAAMLGAVENRAMAGDFLVVVNASNSITSISRADLKRAITGGTKQWGNGAVVQLGLIPRDAPETRYLGSLIDMSTRDLIERIQEQVFKGEMRRPIVLKSSQDCLAFARFSQGAICVMAAGVPIPAEARVVSVQ